VVKSVWEKISALKVFPVGKITEKAVCRSGFCDNITL